MNQKEKRLLSKLKRPRTTNEAIDIIFKEDWSDQEFMGWRYYVHLNKLMAPLSRAGLIKQVDVKIGPNGRDEKVWVRA